MEIGKAVKEVVECNRRRGASSRRWKNMVDDQRGVRTYSLKDKRKTKKRPHARERDLEREESVRHDSSIRLRQGLV